MLTNEQLQVIRDAAKYPSAYGGYFNNDVIRPLLELIDFLRMMISDLKSESTAYDVGLAEGEKQVLNDLDSTVTAYPDVGTNAEQTAIYRFVKTFIQCKQIEQNALQDKAKVTVQK